MLAQEFQQRLKVTVQVPDADQGCWKVSEERGLLDEEPPEHAPQNASFCGNGQHRTGRVCGHWCNARPWGAAAAFVECVAQGWKGQGVFQWGVGRGSSASCPPSPFPVEPKRVGKDPIV
jgi:hypothetical protein